MGRLRSRHAACSESAMAAAESINVPSQSNTSKSNCLGNARFPCFQRIEKFPQIGRQWRLYCHGAATLRMMDHGPRSMQKHPLESLFRQLLVECEVAIFVVPRDRETHMRKVHADLVRAPGLQLGLE